MKSFRHKFGAAFLISTSAAPRWVASFIIAGAKSGPSLRCCVSAGVKSGISRGGISCSGRRIVSSRTPQRRTMSSSESGAAEISPAAAAAAAWDAEAGVWVGDRAAGHEGSIPSPLWIFGLYTAKKVQHPGVHNRVPVHLLDRYGSLCWRPEESFAGFERFDGEVVGWKRLFAQKSMDHRGTPESPGLVATLISDSDLEALGERSAGDPPSRTHGVAYLVPDTKAKEVLAGLDFREKGGYTRATVDVFPARGEDGKRNVGDDTGGGGGSAGATAPKRALLYTATTDNPNFYLSSVEEAAGTIASAVGPSGPNREYLFSLSEYLQRASLLARARCVGTPDPHLTELVDMVRSRIAS
ncbi:unnamed protein product [Pylaiella littoralis]